MDPQQTKVDSSHREETIQNPLLIDTEHDNEQTKLKTVHTETSPVHLLNINSIKSPSKVLNTCMDDKSLNIMSVNQCQLESEQTKLKNVHKEINPVHLLDTNPAKSPSKVLRKDNPSSKTIGANKCQPEQVIALGGKDIDLSKFNTSLKTIQNTIHTLETQVSELISSSTLIQDMNSRLKSVESQIKTDHDIERRLKEIEAKTCTCTSQEMLSSVDRKLKEAEISSNKTKQHVYFLENKIEKIEAQNTNRFEQNVSAIENKLKECEVQSTNMFQQNVSALENKLEEYEIQSTNRSQMLEDKIKTIVNKSAQNSSENKEFIEYLKQENSELKSQNSTLKNQYNILLLESSSNACTFPRKESPTPQQRNRPSGDTMLRDGKHDSSSRNENPLVIPSKETSSGTHAHSKEDNSACSNEQHLEMDEVVYLKTSNRFEHFNETGSAHKPSTNRKNSKNMSHAAEKSDFNPKTKLNIIIDSQGNLLDGTKMYKNMEVKINVLGQGQKNIKGARSHISQQYFTEHDHIIVGVGSNDLTNRHPDWCINEHDEMELLIKDLRLQIPESNIHILPAFERLNNSPFNQDASTYNEKLKLLCAKHGVKYILNDSINTTNTHFFREDNIHFNMKGCIALVRLIKTHMNSSLNMKPYEEYKFSGKQRQPQNRNSSGSAKTNGQPNLLENFLKLLLKNN